MVGRRWVMAVLVAASAAPLAAACSAGGIATDPPLTVGTVPEPETTDTLAPPLTDPAPPDTTAPLPPDALFGGEVCTALTPGDLSFLGRVGEADPVSVDSCAWPVGSDQQVLVQLATPEEFATPAPNGEEIAPLDDVGVDAIGVDLGDTYTVYVQVENGYFSVTAPTRRAAERLAADAAPRATP